MTVESLVVFLLVGAIAGWLANILVRGRGLGLIGNMVVGIIGAFVAGWLFPRLGVVLASGLFGAILNATIGAVLVMGVIVVLKRA